MEITSKLKEREFPSPLNSPTSHGSSSTTTCTCSNTINGNHPPIPITRSDPNSPYPTTFVTADTSSFKQVVQMLTGSSETTTVVSKDQKQANLTPAASSNKNFVIPPIKTGPNKKQQQQQQGFKLYERRSSLKNMISPLTAAAANFSAGHQNASFSPRNKPPEILSPSLLDFPSLTLSPVTPLLEDPFNKSSPSINGGSASSSEEDRAIAQKGFYFHPSPMSTPRDSEPQLLPLFPLSSPRISDPR